MAEEAATKPTTGRQRPLEWTATEYQRPFGVMRLIVTGFFGLLLADILAAATHWILALLVCLATVATLVVQGSRPRSWRYTITDGQLLVESLHPHGPVTTYQLDSFRSFSLAADSTRGDNAVHSTILLIPRRRFSPTFELFLSGTAMTDNEIIERFEDLLPEGQGTAYLDVDTLIHKVAKKLRIE